MRRTWLAIPLLLTLSAAPARSDPGLAHVPIDAASVDGFEAAATPQPGKLLALDSQGVFPRTVIAPCALGQVLKFAAPGWGCGSDDGGTAFTAGTGLTLSGTEFSANFPPAGGDLGAAITVARTDHIHDSRYYTQPQLNAPGTINTASNPVDWTKLKGVPGPIADGSDAIDGGNAANITCTGCIVATELAFDPATQAELDALATPGAINTATNPVGWTKLKGVPAGLADGVDDVSSGPATDVICTNCVHSTDISDESVTAADMANAAVTTAKLADGAVTSFKIADGTVWTTDITDGAVTGAKIFDGSVGVFDLAFDPATQTELDSHKSSADHDGRYFTETELQAAGTINAAANPVDWTKLKGVPAGLADGVDSALERPVFARFAVDTEFAAGIFTSVAVGADGFPFVTYIGNAAFKGVHCTSVSCTTHDAPVILDPAAAVGEYNSVTVGADGFPFVTYRDSSSANFNLKAVHCTSVSCSTRDAPLVLDSTGNVGLYTSVTVGSDSFPFVSYYDFTNEDLKAIHCTSLSCATRDAPLTLDTAAEGAGEYTSVTVGADGFPFISYRGDTFTAGELKVVHCTSASCASRDAPLAVDTVGDVGYYTSVTIGEDGFPFIAYRDGANDGVNADLKAVHCTSLSCSTHSAALTLDTTGNVGEHTAVTLGADGFPFVTYHDASNFDLKSVHCKSLSCASRDAPVALDTVGSVGTHTSVTLGADGFPFVTYFSATNSDLKAVHCSNVRCVPFHRAR